MEYEYILKALNDALKSNEYTANYLREELEKAKQEADALKGIAQEQALTIKKLEEELDFYKPNTKGGKTE